MFFPLRSRRSGCQNGPFRHKIIGVAPDPLRDTVWATFSSSEAPKHTTINKIKVSTTILVIGVIGVACRRVPTTLLVVKAHNSHFSHFAQVWKEEMLHHQDAKQVQERACRLQQASMGFHFGLS